ncbi:ANL_HP_G0194220.mRNA.1.CDS.1 [Saccharomyces cerevisiae]|nr:ANL_HP_G0194220.mRNA.1.CDS.1 [Saccharomyces cerevisiae]CAI6431128.1 ANL_HP_G0194220.mRNA.1.CDS.1 [Saccharomyces cerevisiae]
MGLMTTRCAPPIYLVVSLGPGANFSSPETNVYNYVAKIFLTPRSRNEGGHYGTASNPTAESEFISLIDAYGIGTDAIIVEHIDKIKMRNHIMNGKLGAVHYPGGLTGDVITPQSTSISP